MTQSTQIKIYSVVVLGFKGLDYQIINLIKRVESEIDLKGRAYEFFEEKAPGFMIAKIMVTEFEDDAPG